MPPQLLRCPAPPSPPPAIETQRDVAGYVLDLHEAAAACRGKLDAVRRLVEDGPPPPLPDR